MNAIRNALAGAGILGGILLVGTMDYRDKVLAQEERVAKLEQMCKRKAGMLVTDKNGKFSCAPWMVLSRPL